MSRYRSTFSGLGFRPWTPAVRILIVSCVIAFFVELIDPSFISNFGLTPAQVTHNFHLWQLVTYIFLHATGQPFHIIFNMLGLWMFGSELESLWGSHQFTKFFFICGIGAGHVFAILVKDAFPINVLNSVKMCQEVCRIYCATANPLEVVVAETEQGRGIMGVVDGSSPKGVEQDSDRAARKEMLRKFGYKVK